MITTKRIRQAWDALRGRVQAAASLSEDERDIRGGFRRIASSLSNRDLSPVLQDRMIELAFYLYDRNPFAKRLINLTKVFVMGDGMRPQAEDPDVQAWLDAFWDDPVNDLDINLPGYVAELAVFGEQLYQTTVNPIDGSVRLWYIDPSEIDQVIYAGAAGAERAVAMPLEIKLKDYYPGGERAANLTLEAIRPDEDPSSPSFGKLVGNAFYFAVNKVKRAARGRSDIFALADWLDGYEQSLFAGLDRVELLNSFIWDITLKGMTQAEIDDWLKKYGTRPRPGSLRAHNENVEWKAASPELGSYETANFSRLFKNHILGGAGFPESWFAEGGETNLATAVEQGGPTFKTLKERQRFVKNMAWTICSYAIDQGTLRGSLNPSADRNFEIVAPELEVRDTQKVASAMQTAATALSLAQQEGWIRRETATRIFANVASQLGQPVDAQTELDEMAKGLGPAEADYATGKPGAGTQEPGASKNEPGMVQ